MNNTSMSVRILRNSMNGSAWQTIYSVGVNPWYGQPGGLPWYGDLVPHMAYDIAIFDANALRPPMQYFLDRGCRILSDSPDISAVIAPYGSGSGTSLTAVQGKTFGSSVHSYWNWAICSGDVL
ncbi:hypothetical protein ACIP1U_15905 [Cupriavidus sp. NPDC089707]|uniref:hypothetical protein n=1 Tax=Cupriavidus sp. NPDC089707 TaxID=3363963 RepID=UPI003816D0EC